MTATKNVILWCDGLHGECTAWWEASGAPRVADARREASAHGTGWSYRGGQDLCRDCSDGAQTGGEGQ